MPGLEELKVSLTKNGYFKVAEVIKKHSRNNVLDHIDGKYEGINLDRAQIANMLSADENDQLPEEWDEIKKFTERAIEAFTFISILFSHVDFITALSAARTSEMRGTVSRETLGNKVFTNLRASMQAIGLIVPETDTNDAVTYNFAPLFRLEIGPLVKRILARKLNKTGWLEPRQTDHFTRSFYEQCSHFGFNNVLGLSEQQFEDWLEGRVVQIEVPTTYSLPDKSVTVSASLLAALAAKPFVIIAGTTGTGKTATIRQCATSLNPPDAPSSFNHVFIPVEAGWTDGRHLLGYRNPFGRTGDTYQTTPLISLLLRANHPTHSALPFFVILDEMNLSYVEMYFSRFLSLMETANHGRPESLVSLDDLKLMLRNAATAVEASYIEHSLSTGGLYLRQNVFIVGTVNVDETTHMFSPKVLDRSFVLHYEVPKPSETADEFSVPVSDRATGGQQELSAFLLGQPQHAPDKKHDSFLDDVHQLLGRFAFGPRVTHEVRRYSAACFRLTESADCSAGFNSQTSVRDRILMQKILPKLRGNRSQIGRVVEALISKTRTDGLPQSEGRLSAMKNDLTSPGFSNFFA